MHFCEKAVCLTKTESVLISPCFQGAIDNKYYVEKLDHYGMYIHHCTLCLL
jgi:hypothetical protein